MPQYTFEKTKPDGTIEEWVDYGEVVDGKMTGFSEYTLRQFQTTIPADWEFAGWDGTNACWAIPAGAKG